MTKIVGFALILLGASSALFAFSAVPEVDAGTGGSVLALVTGALLVMRGSRRK